MFSDDMLDPKSDAMKELKELMAKIMELAGKPNISDYFPILKPFDLQGIRSEIKVSYDRLHDLIDEMIDQRLKRRASGSSWIGDFLDVLLDHTDEHGPNKLDHLDVNLLLMVSFTLLFLTDTRL